MQQAKSNLKILLVDDFDMIRTLIKKSLVDLGLTNITEAVDGQDAWEKLDAANKEKAPFDVVFLDWNMPRMNGLDLLVKCRNSREYSVLPIIMITAEREQKAVMEALKAGVTDYIIKPFAPVQIFEKLKRHGIVKAAA
jgi:two-component system chemotaxis response regulator CheY